MRDVVVVGGGSAGCALAGRLGARLGARALLLEAGPVAPLPELSDVTSLAATAPGHPRNWARPVLLRPGHAAVVPWGRGLGGSSAINGANWVRATRAEDWGPGWTWDDLLPHYERSESDPWHGTTGPVPVRRPSGELLHPAAERFLDAAQRLGFAAEPDKNAGGAPGAGPVPTNSVDGVRVSAATAYRPEHVRGDAPVARVLFDGARARGVELESGEVVEAGEVVLAAGAVGTPRLLLRSGIGPGLRVDLPVGRDFSDHPSVYLPFADDDPPAHPHAPGSQVALNWDAGADPAGDVEVLAFVRPFAPGGPLHLMCALQHPDSRGELTLDRIEYRYLRTEHDRRRLRHAIRTAADLLRAGVGRRIGPGGDVLGNDRTLDAWIAEHLTTSVHLCGTAAIGRVVDAELRVLGVEGLRVADTSVLPTVPRRGPSATAVAIGEKAATLLT
ncbi:GMC family oxidoreductase N-terminal domain-containing protein [Pseudonocardia sp. KRD-182]|uniref:GMC family oxidoreductase N-terminal domain-containing protein n=1 Tax=Pseudonocardia oceani TaxID=2792013 RepID=A0ABS6U937_9PSEU|nr:GMC family oxidoreductase N-terminal domain-containing protein [Pseudonocardia oceani]MBW0121437.1 GMC family oxidoreductase N-terminal domain-containing protein [Pseudonocardia oceani]MBW0128761.1 GMC family oxidoreductase N-terminal domain-containing protein [Pseudonocardia oceani]